MKFKPGISFGDFIFHEVAKASSADKQTDFSNWSLVIGRLIIVVSMGLLLVRLLGLQVFQGGSFRILADENRIKRIKLSADRGKILDVTGTEIPAEAATAHILGYLGKVGSDEVGLLKDNGGKYDGSDWVGRTGLQEQYESSLRGVDGGRLVEVDNQGQEVRVLGEQKPIPGKNLDVHLDSKLQRLAYELLDGRKGAVVMSKPTGEIVTLVSSPSFDPNKLSDQYSAFSVQKNLPLFNRAIGGIYPPGSPFKMVTTTAALSENLVKSDFIYDDKGAIYIDKFSYTNWYFTQHGKTEGWVGFAKALARSTDTFFYKVGEMTGAQNLHDWAIKFGFGQKTDIDIPGEVAGLVPDPSKRDWFLGNTYHLAIGQSDLLATPIQVAQMTNILASEGKKCKLQIAQGLSTQCSVLSIDDQALKLIKQGMIEACEQDGTAPMFADFEPKVACKTGTAEYALPSGKFGTHAWFVAFAPADEPEITVTVLVEAGGEGSKVAAPIAKKLLEEYFK